MRMRPWLGRRISVMVPAVAVVTSVIGCTHPLERTWRSYREAKRRSDTASTAKYLADDARIWFDKKEGPGAPLRPAGGPYKDWDREFRSRATHRDLRVTGRTLTYVTLENNDFYRLIERAATEARVTYYFDEGDKITGMLYQGLSPREKRPPDRFGEFKTWAQKHHAGLLDSDEMEIPNQPRRWRTLLTEWRQDAGLPPID